MVTMSYRLRRCLILYGILLGMFCGVAQPASAHFQRMRIPAGSFRLKPGPGNTASIRANCVDEARKAPTREHTLRAAASSPIKVARWPVGRPSEVVEQPISDVLGKWLEFRGNDSTTSLDVTILEPKFEYEIRVSKGSPGLLGPPSKENPATSTDAEALVKALATTPVNRALQKLDEFEQLLSELCGKDSAEGNQFQSIAEDIEAVSIYHFLQRTREPEKAADEFLRVARRELFSPSILGEEEPTADQAYRRTAIRSGSLLTKNQALALGKIFGKDEAIEPPAGLKGDIEKLAADASTAKEMFGEPAGARFRELVAEFDGEFDSYDRAKVEAQRKLGAEFVSEETLTPKLLHIACALNQGKALQPQQLDSIVRLFGIRPTQDLDNATQVAQCAKDLQSVRGVYSAKDESLIRRSFANSLADGKLASTARRRAADRIVEFYAKKFRGTRSPGRLSAIVMPERLTPEQQKLLVDWEAAAKDPDLYRDLVVLKVERGEHELAVRLVGEALDSSIPLSTFTSKVLLTKVGQRRVIADPLAIAAMLVRLPSEERQEVKRRVVPLEDFLQVERQAAFKVDIEGKINVSRHVNADPADQLQVEMVRLRGEENRGLGDGIIVHFPNDRLLLIDTGNDAEGLSRIEERLKYYQMERLKEGNPLLVDILITHEDRDHIAGLKEILARLAKPEGGGIEIGNIIFGFHRAESSLARDVIAKLRQLFEVTHPTKNLLVGKRASAKNDEIRIVTKPFGDVCVTRILGVGNVHVSVYQVRDPRSPNDSSLVVRLEHKGVAQLLTGDIEIEAMKKLMDSKFVDLRADVMKWPHHRSFPSDWSPKERQIVRNFLMAVSPHTVCVSNLGSKQTPQMEKDLEDFVRGVLDNPISGLKVRIETTNDRVDPDSLKATPGKSSLRQIRKNRDRGWYDVLSLAA